MEIWDILNSDGKMTGKTVKKGTRLEQGEYHLMVHIWIIDQNGHFLIQKRAIHREWMPGLWCTTGCSVIHKENSFMAAFREISESLGLLVEPEMFLRIKRLKRENEFIDIWLIRGAREDFLPIILSNDLEDVYWVSWNALMEMVSRKEFIRYDYLENVMDDFSLASVIFEGQQLPQK